MIFYFPFLLCQVNELPCQSGMKIIAILMEAAKKHFYVSALLLNRYENLLACFPFSNPFSVLESVDDIVYMQIFKFLLG